MVILHIGSFGDNPSSGVAVVVPQHVKAQQKIEMVGLLNTSNFKIAGIVNQIEYKNPFSLSSLPEPFNKPDLAVFHSIYIPAYIKIANELTKANIPYVIAPHGSLTKEAQMKKWWKKLPANMIAFRKFFKGAVAYQYLSEKEQASSSKFSGRWFIGTNGMNIPQKKKNSFNEMRTEFTYIGRLDPFHKGLDLMISAISSIKEYLKENNCKFSIYGPDSEGWRKAIENLIKENKVETLVELNDAAFGEDKIDKLLSSDIFIQTSRFEGMPMGILEALSYGVPCLVTEGTNLGRIISDFDAGWTAQTTVESISEIIIKAINERHFWKDKSNNAIKLIKENFEWDNIARKTLEEYKGMLS